MATGTRKAQRERTRENLLDAAMMCLVEYGYAGTTTQRVQERVGVSRGALLHHFGSKAELFVAAIHHIADKRLESIRDLAVEVDDQPDALRRVIQAIAHSQTGPPFQAAMELWTAARTDPELLEALRPAERKLGRAMRDIFYKAADFDDPETARITFESLVAMMRGLEMTRIMRRDETLADEVIDLWIEKMITPVQF
ncbi:TetR/AcrR family transcriptional regulator [Rhodococcus zopfii]|uniref:TetR/AcrR family transcriptional regulator n=1 Tax=Rhodococcus zopfii TaxID=43772 RepID=A0ABU3WX07_9NOCA|nr:TetR/AcrR family transcriptional regulator [Rhodococcus zopfii]MDV2478526.1 TetR/AcrR family transcriptional regulator [Rhodococcus zopfii]